MKKFYEINIAHRGKVETHTFKTKKEKNDKKIRATFESRSYFICLVFLIRPMTS